ncbi:hypothetical protein [Bacteroides acidifaciens]|uniref:hypothetical protein n=1 Tax=Bacteroides acidifaciens TaxID=85831 RepID=UPI003014A3EF
MEKINGIVYHGKFYESVEQDIRNKAECDLYEQCNHPKSYDSGLHSALLCLCQYIGKDNIFRHSPELTERLNNSKTKEK